MSCERKIGISKYWSSMVPRRRAFTLAEILVGVAIVGVLTAVLITGIGGFIEKGRIARISNTLQTLAIALREFERNVGAFPEDLRSLSVQPTITDTNICGVKFSAAEVAKWRGPYVTFPITAPGIPIETDTVVVQLEREPSTPVATTDKGNLHIFINTTKMLVAQDIQANLDGDNQLLEGTIQWNSNKGYPRMIFAVPISGC